MAKRKNLRSNNLTREAIVDPNFKSDYTGMLVFNRLATLQVALVMDGSVTSESAESYAPATCALKMELNGKTYVGNVTFEEGGE